jgi:hypothetical protein
MLLINDVIINQLDESFKIKSYDFVSKFGNIPTLEKILNLKAPIKKNDYVRIYTKKEKLYKIYNASVDDSLLNLLDKSFCNDKHIKFLNPLWQYAMDATVLKLSHQNEEEWFHVLKRYSYAQNIIVEPLLKSNLDQLVKVITNYSNVYRKWFNNSKALISKYTAFKSFDKFSFEDLIALSCGKGKPLYTSLYEQNHNYINNEKFQSLEPENKAKAIFQLISTYTLNEYVVENDKKKYNDEQIKTFFRKTYMKYANEKFDYNIKLYLLNNYNNVMSAYDSTFYTQFKTYLKYATD